MQHFLHNIYKWTRKVLRLLWTPSGNRSRWAEFLHLTKWWYLCFGSAVLIICRTAELRTSSPWVVISDGTYWNSSRSYKFKLWADVTVKGVISPGTTRKTKSLLSHVREPAGSEKKHTRSEKLDSYVLWNHPRHPPRHIFWTLALCYMFWLLVSLL